MRMFKRALVAAACCSLVACDPNAGNTDSASVTFDGNKTLILVADFTPNAQSIGIAAFADVDVGTVAALEMTGPLHMRCDGAFQPAPTDSSYLVGGNRPDFVLDSFAAPAGQYTVIASIPSHNVQVKKTFRAGVSYIDPLTNVWDLPIACVQVADTRRQLTDLTHQRVQAVTYWVGRMDNSPMKAQLLSLAATASASVLTGDQPGAIDALLTIRDTVQPLTSQGPYYSIFRDAKDAIALMEQPVPAS
jgi:hypothetical protein